MNSLTSWLLGAWRSFAHAYASHPIRSGLETLVILIVLVALIFTVIFLRFMSALNPDNEDESETKHSGDILTGEPVEIVQILEGDKANDNKWKMVVSTKDGRSRILRIPCYRKEGQGRYVFREGDWYSYMEENVLGNRVQSRQRGVAIKPPPLNVAGH